MAYNNQDRKPLVRIGALWKGKAGSKAVLTGSLRINGQDVGRVMVMDNREWKKKDSDPDFVIKAEEGTLGAKPYQGGGGASRPAPAGAAPAAKGEDLSEFGL